MYKKLWPSVCRPWYLRSIHKIPVRYQSVQSRVQPDEYLDHDNVESTTGMLVSRAPGQNLVYINNVYNLSRILPLSWVTWLGRFANHRKQFKYVERIVLSGNLPVRVDHVIPRIKDGGLFVQYTIFCESSAQPTHEEIVRQMNKTLHDSIQRGFLVPSIYQVKGVPWIEDLRRSISPRLRVTFEGEPVGQEVLYSFFRRYGPIRDIEGETPLNVNRSPITLIYSNLWTAATARNCLTGMTLPGGKTVIHVTFDPLGHRRMIWNSVVHHPLISIPLVLALLAAAAVVIFEPVRVWFIKKKVKKTLSVSNLPFYDHVSQWTNRTFNKLNSLILGSASGQKSSANLQDLWKSRQSDILRVRQWVSEGAGTFVVVHGPKGSGKNDLVFDHALKDRENVLVLDCEKLISARLDISFLTTCAEEVGYYPFFAWTNSLTSFIDLAVQGVTGQKSGISESTQQQLKNILDTCATALTDIVLENKIAAEKRQESPLTLETYLDLHPEDKPVVVLSNFHVSSLERPFLSNDLIKWAAGLLKASIAHVIIVTSDSSFAKPLTAELPDTVIKSQHVGDADFASAKKFVLKQLELSNDSSLQRSDEKEIDAALKPLGGRMTDLQTLARRLISGETPALALADMVNQSASEITQRFLFKDSNGWSLEQAWTLVKLFVEQDALGKAEIPMAKLAANPYFRDNNKALQALEEQEMITLNAEGGRIRTVTAARPLYVEAFKALHREDLFRTEMDVHILEGRLSSENSKISRLEAELTELAKLPSRWEFKSRMDFLARKLATSQAKVEQIEQEIRENMSVIFSCN